MLTATSPSLPAPWRAARINSPCALCNAPIVGTSARRCAHGCACASAMVVRIFTAALLVPASGTHLNQRLCHVERSETSLIYFRWANRSKLIRDSSLAQNDIIGRLVLCEHEIVRFASKQQDEDAGDHQREHPEQIDIEPGVAQYSDPEFFANHDRDQHGGYKIA